MPDTLRATLTVLECPDIDFKAEVSAKLEKVIEKSFNGIYYLVGHVGDVRVHIYDISIVIMLNLTKYRYGHNFSILTRTDIETALKMLSEKLGLPLELAKITQLDFGQPIETIHPASAYLNYLGKVDRFRRLEHHNGIEYRQAKESWVIYDKPIEYREKRIKIPIEFVEKNLLRIELHGRKRLSDIYSVNKVTGAMLYDRKFYNRLVNKWEKFFFSIHKYNKLNIHQEAVRDNKSFQDFLMVGGIQHYGGEKEIEDLLKITRHKSYINQVQHHRLKTKVVELVTKPAFIEKCEMVSELEIKVKELAEKLRNE